MPVGLGRLQDLHTLWELNLPSNRAEGWCTIEELRSLSCLTDLSIGRLECVSSSSEARAAELRNKSKLSSLELHCTPVLHPSEEKMKRIEEVFEELHPPPSLEQLQIDNYFGREFPKWMAETSSSSSILFPNLRQLVLNGYRYCERFPPWGLLPNLQYLFIRHADSVMDVGPEFLVGTSSTSSDGGRAAVDTSKYAFPRLETLMFRHMSNWQEWHWEKGTEAMPCLKDLYLDNCPKLMSLPEGLLLHATSLTKLEISFADSLTTIENLLSLKELHVKYNPNLEKISNLPALTTLAVNNCPKLKVVENLRYLKRMKLIDYAMKSLPSYLLKGVHTPHLEELEIWCSMELIRNICESDSREWQIIQGIQQVHVYSQDELVHALYNQSPFSFSNICRLHTPFQPWSLFLPAILVDLASHDKRRVETVNYYQHPITYNQLKKNSMWQTLETSSTWQLFCGFVSSFRDYPAKTQTCHNKDINVARICHLHPEAKYSILGVINDFNGHGFDKLELPNHLLYPHYRFSVSEHKISESIKKSLRRMMVVYVAINKSRVLEKEKLEWHLIKAILEFNFLKKFMG
uniref:Disease resistance RPP13-like protein 1 n=1 Tax=Elaeis guineensis var. tenera TaxID=51953 RepID=A0A8N4IAH4_ELAGV|nr:putative disease resistance RPP13-like protein 1 [Elaeis guineensis]